MLIIVLVEKCVEKNEDSQPFASKFYRTGGYKCCQNTLAEQVHGILKMRNYLGRVAMMVAKMPWQNK
jgi:hypothetical protein